MEKFIKTESSFIRNLVYKVDKKTLDVTFKNGTRRRYSEVTPQRVAQLEKAESKGSYYSKHIKGKYESRKLTAKEV